MKVTPEFLEAYERASGKKLTKEVNVKEFTKQLNKHSVLRKMFRELTATTPEEDIGAGMGNLFG